MFEAFQISDGDQVENILKSFQNRMQNHKKELQKCSKSGLKVIPEGFLEASSEETVLEVQKGAIISVAKLFLC